MNDHNHLNLIVVGGLYFILKYNNTNTGVLLHLGTLMEHVILESLAFAVAPAALFSLAFLRMLETVFFQPQGPY